MANQPTKFSTAPTLHKWDIKEEKLEQTRKESEKHNSSTNIDRLRSRMATVVAAFDLVQKEVYQLANAAMTKDEPEWRSLHVSVEVINEALNRFREVK